jgi:hypothetical protein
MNADIDASLERLEAKLDLVAHLLLLAVQPEKSPNITEQIAILRAHGLTPAEIGKVIGRKANYVSAMGKTTKKGGKSGD